MSAQTCLVTGTTHGIGLATARTLAERGLEVVMACRDERAAEAVRARLRVETGNPGIHVVRCDLASLLSVRMAAAAILDEFDDLHLLINNAGTMLNRRQLSEDGIELTFAVNHLGPFLLTRLLLPRLLATGNARIVNVASTTHFSGSIDIEMLRSSGATRSDYRGMTAYADSKLGNVMFTLSLADRLPPERVTANCLHPGVVATNITGAANAFFRVGAKIAAPLMRSPERGAHPTLHLALDERVAGVTGKYFDERLRAVPPAPAALNESAREALWRWSERICGLEALPLATAP